MSGPMTEPCGTHHAPATRRTNGAPSCPALAAWGAGKWTLSACSLVGSESAGIGARLHFNKTNFQSVVRAAAEEARWKRMIGPGVARFIKVTSHFTSHFSATEGPRTWSPPVRYIGQIERQHVSFIFHTPVVLEERGVGGRREGSCSRGEIWSVHSEMLYIYNACPQQGPSNPPTIPAILTKATIGGPENKPP